MRALPAQLAAESRSVLLRLPVVVQVEGTCFISGTKAGEPVADGILAVASRLDVDILVMGISGYG